MKRDQALDHVKKLTTDDRNKTHGDPLLQFTKAQRIKAAVGHQQNPNLTPVEIECIEMICVKLSRWTSGTARTSEHALDIIGYAAIAVEAIPEPKPEVIEKVDTSAQAQIGTPDISPFAGVGQVARRFAPNPRKVEAPPEGSAA